MSAVEFSVHSRQNPIGAAALIAALAIAGILAIYYQTTWSMIATWSSKDTYAHGFLILPFVIYMIWTKRQSIAVLNQHPSPTALFGLCALGFFWLVADLASVLIVTQYALVAMLPLAVAAILGYRIMFAIAFPLAYLFFAVPFGDVLIPPLINFTADFTVKALQLSGIPVYREGTFFSLPTGNWSVVEACSGLRYLIASVTLGTLYAYLTYYSLSKRLIFIAFSIVVPIIANGIRAYLIVMTGHLSDMKYAVGVDHLIYGWIFFGLVMLLLFWLGSFWREDKGDAIDGNGTFKNELAASKNDPASIYKTTLVACAALVVAFIWPVYATYLEKNTDHKLTEFNLSLPDHKWKIAKQPISDWKPIYIGQPEQIVRHYKHNEDRKVSLYITYYHNQNQEGELINFGNALVPEKDSRWRKIHESNQSILIDSREVTVRQAQLSSYTNNLLIWRWYVLGNDETIRPYIAKALMAKNILLTGNDSGAEIIVAALYETEPDEAKSVLQEFLVDMLPSIRNGLENYW